MKKPKFYFCGKKPTTNLHRLHYRNIIEDVRWCLLIATNKKNCIFDHTCNTNYASPSWFTSKTSSLLYVTDIVSAVRWTSFLTVIPIYSRGFTAWNNHLNQGVFIAILVIFKTLFYINLIIVCCNVNGQCVPNVEKALQKTSE